MSKDDLQEQDPVCPTCHVSWAGIERRLRERAEAVERLAAIRKVVDEQAEDAGLWFAVGASAPEAYLMQELRRLHAAVEGE